MPDPVEHCRSVYVNRAPAPACRDAPPSQSSCWRRGHDRDHVREGGRRIAGQTIGAPCDVAVGTDERCSVAPESEGTANRVGHATPVLFKSRGLAQLALGAIAVGPHALRVLDTLLGLLEEGGVNRATAAWAVDLLILYVTAIAAERSERSSPTEGLGPVAQAIARASRDEYPNIHAASAELVSGEGKERFSWAIEVLISGVLQGPRPQANLRRTNRKRRTT